jgi:hypothetical protein
MNKIEETSKQTTTINQACGISRMLQDPIFLFWLTMFSRIMPHCDILYNQLQKTCTDAVEIQQCIKTFEDSIQKERNNIDSVQNEIPEAATQVKRRRTNEDPYLSKRGQVISPPVITLIFCASPLSKIPSVISPPIFFNTFLLRVIPNKGGFK